MDAAKKAYENLADYVASFKAEAGAKNLSSEEEKALAQLVGEFDGYLFDDLKTPVALSYMWSVVKDNSKSAALRLAFLMHVDGVLHLFLKDVAPKQAQTVEVTPEITALLEQRAAARAATLSSSARRPNPSVSMAAYSLDPSRLRRGRVSSRPHEGRVDLV